MPSQNSRDKRYHAMRGVEVGLMLGNIKRALIARCALLPLENPLFVGKLLNISLYYGDHQWDGSC